MNLPFDLLVERLKLSEIQDFAELDTLQLEFQRNENPNWSSIELCRMQGSNTLINGIDKNSWQNGNRLLAKWIEANEAFDFQKINELNATLVPEHLGAFRDHPIYAAMGEFMDFQSLPRIKHYFDQVVFQPINCEHEPVVRAAMIYQGLSTFHPFKDGNGRTARLAADFELIRNGYLPLSFENPFDGMCAIKSNTPHIDGNFGLRKTIKWLCNSYRLGLGSF